MWTTLLPPLIPVSPVVDDVITRPVKPPPTPEVTALYEVLMLSSPGRSAKWLSHISCARCSSSCPRLWRFGFASKPACSFRSCKAIPSSFAVRDRRHLQLADDGGRSRVPALSPLDIESRSNVDF